MVLQATWYCKHLPNYCRGRALKCFHFEAHDYNQMTATLAEQLYTKVPQRSSARKQNFAQTDQNATHAEETVCLLILKSIS